MNSASGRRGLQVLRANAAILDRLTRRLLDEETLEGPVLDRELDGVRQWTNGQATATTPARTQSTP